MEHVCAPPQETRDDGVALRIGARKGVKELFQGCNASLEAIQKSLEDFLEKKRRAFPRFYFLSNDELLEILAQRDPAAVQRHLNKCFDNLNRLELSGGGNGALVDITAMISLEGEVIELGRNLRARGMVEEWLAAVRSLQRACYPNYCTRCLTLVGVCRCCRWKST